MSHVVVSLLLSLLLQCCVSQQEVLLEESDDLLVARKKAREAENTSDLTDGEDSSRRHIRSKRVYSSSDNDDRDVFHHHRRQNQQQKRNIFCNSEHVTDNESRISEVTTAEENLHQAAASTSTEKTSEINRDRILEASHTSVSSGNRTLIGSGPNFEYSAMQMLITIQEQNKIILEWIRQQNQKEFAPKSTLLELPVNFPLTSDEELQAIEEFLASDKNFGDLCDYFGAFAGQSVTGTVNQIMKHSFSNKLAMKYSFKGKKGKRPFEDLNIKTVIVPTIESLHAPTGGGVELPCDVTPALPDDQMGLVIWYKQGHDSPIYSLDTREGVTSHWSDPSTLGSRATFRADTRPAVLVLTKLRPEDSGQYRCRVDFIKSPTKNTRLNLTVLIPPERLIVLDQEGNEIQGGTLGPYDEGTEVNLTCVAVGGRPTARVSWWKSHALLANSEARATMSFRLQRSDYGTDVTCQAVTDPSIPPVSETLTIDVNLRPLWVRLQGGKRPLVAGQSTELVCQVVGARPKPVISWWKAGSKLNTVRSTSSTDGNITSSILTFVPSIEDAGRSISCRAVQPSLPHSSHEDGFKMEIQHLPVAELKLGANLDATKVVEGSDVYLDCRVRANPWHNHVYFSHNGVVVKPGPGVLLANQSLVLQKVSRKAAGAYVCTARNSLGEGSSERLILDVKYSPTCRSSQPTVMRAARGEVLEIECDLDSNPKEPMTFHWWFNSSTHSKHELSTSTVNTAQNTQGSFLYMVNTSADYGWVQCSGTNSVGRQSKPCLFHILPADKPSSVKACEISNVTYDSVTLNCTPGHDGGIRQSFMLQIYDKTTRALLRNVTSDEPEFEVTGLSTNNPLEILVIAYNRKGASESVRLTSNLLKYPERHTAQVPVKVELTTVLVIVLATVGVVATVTAMSGLVFCVRYCNKRDNKNEKDKRQQDETSNIPLTGTKESESVDSLDKNPDIIPLDGKISDNCSNKSSTTDYSSIRPLISKNSSDKYDAIPPNCDRYYDHNIDGCNQYIQVRPMEYRVRPPYQTNLPMPNLGPSIQSLGPMSSLGHMPNTGPSDCHRPYDKYEEWLKFKNTMPLSTSGLLPPEQIMPPELYATPPPALYSNPSRNPLNLAQMPELEPRYHLDTRPHLDRGLERGCSSPPVRFENSSVYYSKIGGTLPHLKTRINGNSPSQTPSELVAKTSATKSTDTATDRKPSQEC